MNLLPLEPTYKAFKVLAKKGKGEYTPAIYAKMFGIVYRVGVPMSMIRCPAFAFSELDFAENFARKMAGWCWRDTFVIGVLKCFDKPEPLPQCPNLIHKKTAFHWWDITRREFSPVKTKVGDLLYFFPDSYNISATPEGTVITKHFLIERILQ